MGVMRRIFGWIALVGIMVACNSSTAPVLTADEQLVYDVAIIDKYLSENRIDAVKLDNGLRYTIEQVGSGPFPTKDNCIRIKYSAYILYEVESFNSNTTTGYKAPLKQLISGVQIMLKLMQVGGKATVYIPSGLAYKTQRQPSSPVPPNTILKYELELVEIGEYNALGSYCY